MKRGAVAITVRFGRNALLPYQHYREGAGGKAVLSTQGSGDVLCFLSIALPVSRSAPRAFATCYFPPTCVLGLDDFKPRRRGSGRAVVGAGKVGAR